MSDTTKNLPSIILNPKLLIIAERFKSHRRNQVTVAQFVAELRKLVEHCKFRNARLTASC